MLTATPGRLSTTIQVLLFLWLALACKNNQMYDDLLLEASPDYYLLLNLFDTSTDTPLGNHRVIAYRENRDSFQLVGDISASQQMMWSDTDNNGNLSMHLPGGYYRLMVQTPAPDFVPYASLAMAVTPKGNNFNTAPKVQFSQTGFLVPTLVQAIPIIPTGKPLYFTGTSLPDITIRASQFISEYPRRLPVAGGTPPYFIQLISETITPTGFNVILDNITREFFFTGYLSSLPGTLNSDFGGLPLGNVTFRVRDAQGNEIQSTFSLNARFKYAFISDQATKGDMSGLTYPGCLGSGVQRADCACQVQAQLAGLPNPAKFRALLDTDTASAKCRLANISGTCPLMVPATAGGPWYSPRKEITIGIFGRNKYFDEMFSMLSNVLTTNAFGGENLANVWTGTLGNGDTPAIPVNCNNWTDASNSFNGNVGLSSNTSYWAYNTFLDCSSESHIYCFETN